MLLFVQEGDQYRIPAGSKHKQYQEISITPWLHEIAMKYRPGDSDNNNNQGDRKSQIQEAAEMIYSIEKRHRYRKLKMFCRFDRSFAFIFAQLISLGYSRPLLMNPFAVMCRDSFCWGGGAFLTDGPFQYYSYFTRVANVCSSNNACNINNT